MPQAVEHLEAGRSRILIGGGGAGILRLAGRYADIVGINPSLRQGRMTLEACQDMTPDRIARKLDWVREGAEASGRSVGDLELNTLTYLAQISDDPTALRQQIATATGLTSDQVAESPLFLTGSAQEICDRLVRRREVCGISYYVIQGRDHDALEQFAEQVVAPLRSWDAAR